MSTDKQLIGWLEFIKFEDDEDRHIADKIIKRLKELEKLNKACKSLIKAWKNGRWEDTINLLVELLG